MKESRIGLLVVAALGVFPANGWAQAKAAVGAEAGAEVAADGEAAAGGEAAAEGDATGEVPGEGEEGDVPGSDVGDICKIDPAACPVLDMDKEAKRPIKENLFAVQQIFALRVRRFEVQPYWAFTLNDQFVSHNAPGIALNYYISNVLAIGGNFNYHSPFNVDQEFNAQVRRAARVAVPLTEYDWGAALNFTYVPAYGKFSGFGDFIFHYDAYVVGGVGARATRPQPGIDPDNRNFEFEPKLAFNAGIGLRIFFNRWFAAILEVRDYIFNDQLENLETDPVNPQDPNTWYGENSLTNHVQAQVGVSIFLPFSFDYRLPK